VPQPSAAEGSGEVSVACALRRLRDGGARDSSVDSITKQTDTFITVLCSSIGAKVIKLCSYLQLCMSLHSYKLLIRVSDDPCVSDHVLLRRNHRGRTGNAT